MTPEEIKAAADKAAAEKAVLEGATNVDPEVLERMIAKATEEFLNAEAPKKDERKDPPMTDARPKVNGERIPAWQNRAFHYMHNVLKSESKDQDEKNQGLRGLAEYGRQARSISAFQRDEEDKFVNDVIADSGLSKRVQSRLHSTLSGPNGEFALPKPFMAELFVLIETYGHARRLARIVPMTSKTLDLTGIATKPVAAWTGENVLIPESDLTLNQNVLTTNKLGAVTTISKEQDEDAWVALLPSWMELLAESIAQKEDEAWMRGTGTSDFGGFTGITNLTNAQIITAGSSDLKFSDIIETDWRSVKAQLSPVRRNGAEWLVHRNMVDVMEQYESTGGQRIFQPALQENARPRFLGFPINTSEALVDATADVANVDFGILGNYKRSLMGIARGLTVETSTDGVLSNAAGAVTYNALQQDGMILKISTRVGFQTPLSMQDAFAILNAPAS
ncbi:phage major capsid protein [bacterium]|nr:phage major capsid protein [bacterium]